MQSDFYLDFNSWLNDYLKNSFISSLTLLFLLKYRKIILNKIINFYQIINLDNLFSIKYNIIDMIINIIIYYY